MTTALWLQLGAFVLVIAGGVFAFSVGYGKLSERVEGFRGSHVSHGDHNAMCHQKMLEVYTEIGDVAKDLNAKYADMHGKICEMHGWLKRKNGDK